jgi:hypothetical protein
MTEAIYRHVQAFRFLWLSLPLMTLWAGKLVLDSGDPGARPALAIVGATSAALLLLLGRLVVELRGGVLRWHYGFVGWPRYQAALGEIVRLERVRTSPWQGAGIRGLGKHRLFNASLGGPALRLTMRDGRTMTLGTPDAERLAAFIEARRPPPR